MKLTFLGTNGWYSNRNANTICTLLETEKNYIVFDAGDGIHKLDQFIKDKKPIVLFLRHLHIDHIVGFHIFTKFRFENDMTIICPKGARKDLEKFINHPFTAPLNERKFKVKIEEVNEGRHEIPIAYECKKNFHVDLCFGYRLKIEGKSIVYLCDTGICDNAKALAQNADVVIHECSMGSDVSAGSWGHANPEEASRMAKEAGVKKLILTHFSALDYPSQKERDIAQEIAQKIFPNTICVEDDLVMEI
ncbi:MAG: MBL fold metallo-hydrolase [Candidatus Moranbacteria bacterium]|nr:MBL fold metallo-hydrolase [Candidatus Moranbacteria bacterium]